MRLEDSKEWQTLTPEQQSALRKLNKSGKWFAVRFSVKFVFLFFVSILAVGLVNHFYVGSSTTFGFLAGGINGIFLGRYFISSMKKEYDRIGQEVKKILKAQ